MKALLLLAILPILFITACQKSNPVSEQAQAVSTQEDKMLSIATFAGGCFWCTEADFEKLPGVVKVISGYTGGSKINPTYEEVSAGASGHVEAVQVYYDPAKLTYEELVDYFWKHIDPTDGGGQFVDRGGQYTSAIFYHDEAQKLAAEKSKDDLGKTGWFDKPIATRLVKFTQFYPAEDYHQDYYKKNPLRYGYYRNGSGRDQFLNKTWGKEKKPHPPAPSPQAGKGGEEAVVGARRASPKAYEKPDEAVLRQRLTPLQYQVTQKEGTEPAFRNDYWDNKREGIYVDLVSGEPLFSSRDKFDSGTGWPSFTKPIAPDNIVEREDRGLFTKRTEIRSKHGDSHLGHVFNDGPAPTGLRYCMNSAALRFIPQEDLEQEGYGEYARLFEKVGGGR